MAQVYQPGETFYSAFSVADSTGAPVWNAAGVAVLRNGVVQAGIAVTIGTPLIGVQSYSFTLPGSIGDSIQTIGTASVGGVNVSQVVDSIRLDLPGSIVASRAAGLYGTATNLGTTDRATLTTIQNSASLVGGLYGTAATLPGTTKTTIDRLATMQEVDGSNYRYTTASLVNAPSGGGGGGGLTTVQDELLKTGMTGIIASMAGQPIGDYRLRLGTGNLATLSVSRPSGTPTITATIT